MKFTPPTIEEVKLHAAKIGLPEIEAEKFFCYYESNGWRVGRNPMAVWRGALAGWKLRWQERAGEKQQRLAERKELNPTALLILRQKELERVENRMKELKGAHFFDDRWDEKDYQEQYKYLWNRKKELLQLLGMQA